MSHIDGKPWDAIDNLSWDELRRLVDTLTARLSRYESLDASAPILDAASVAEFAGLARSVAASHERLRKDRQDCAELLGRLHELLSESGVEIDGLHDSLMYELHGAISMAGFLSGEILDTGAEHISEPVSPRPVSREFIEALRAAGARESVTAALLKDLEKAGPK